VTTTAAPTLRTPAEGGGTRHGRRWWGRHSIWDLEHAIRFEPPGDLHRRPQAILRCPAHRVRDDRRQLLKDLPSTRRHLRPDLVPHLEVGQGRVQQRPDHLVDQGHVGADLLVPARVDRRTSRQRLGSTGIPRGDQALHATDEPTVRRSFKPSLKMMVIQGQGRLSERDNHFRYTLLLNDFSHPFSKVIEFCRT
jgi:hypothetical protein